MKMVEFGKKLLSLPSIADLVEKVAETYKSGWEVYPQESEGTGWADIHNLCVSVQSCRTIVSISSWMAVPKTTVPVSRSRSRATPTGLSATSSLSPSNTEPFRERTLVVNCGVRVCTLVSAYRQMGTARAIRSYLPRRWTTPESTSRTSWTASLTPTVSPTGKRRASVRSSKQSSVSTHARESVSSVVFP